MAKTSTKDRVLNYLEARGWVSGTELEAMTESWATKSSIIRRRTQELAADGFIERQLSARRTVEYKTKAPAPKPIPEQVKLMEVPLRRQIW